MDLTGSIPSVGYKELIKKDLGFIAYPNQKKNLHLWGRFLLFTFGFCKKRAFFRLKSIFSPEWLTLWLWNHDILKVRSKCDPMVYDMSMFHENSSTQIFFTKKCQLSHRKVVVPWTLSYTLTQTLLIQYLQIRTLVWKKLSTILGLGPLPT